MATLFDDEKFFDSECEPELDPAIPILSFTVMGRPQQRGSKVAMVLKDRDGKPIEKNGRILTFNKDMNEQNSKAWMACVQSAARDAFGLNRPLITVPLCVDVKFYFARPQSHFGTGANKYKLKPSAPRVHAQSPDVDKLVRCLLDALTGQIYGDDKQIARVVAQRYWTESQERAEVVLFTVGE